MLLQLKISLQGTRNPEVWRRIKVPLQFNFEQLHQVIQASMGWRNAHLYSFSENAHGDLLRITSRYEEDGPIFADQVEIGPILMNLYNWQLMHGKKKAMVYLYDYGDSWEHTITVEDFIRENGNKPEILDGQGACPPEDCGGIFGFEDLKECLVTGSPSKLHGERWEPWLKECGYKNYDPSVFDLKAAKKRLGK